MRRNLRTPRHNCNPAAACCLFLFILVASSYCVIVVQQPPHSFVSEMVGNPVFPVKLHRMLSEAHAKGFDDIVSWNPDGKAFIVHDKARFESEIMPSHFGTSKFRSFQKNLNMWGFSTVRSGPLRGHCSHPLFVMDSLYLCHRLVRRSPILNDKRSALSVANSMFCFLVC